MILKDCSFNEECQDDKNSIEKGSEHQFISNKS